MSRGILGIAMKTGLTDHPIATASNSVEGGAPTSGTTSAEHKILSNITHRENLAAAAERLSRWLQLATTRCEARQSACEAHVLSNRRPRAYVMLLHEVSDPPLVPNPRCGPSLPSDGMHGKTTCRRRMGAIEMCSLSAAEKCQLTIRYPHGPTPGQQDLQSW